jgi:hypothetical protein
MAEPKTDLFTIILTSLLTVISGVLVLGIGQLLTKFIIEPLHEQKKLMGEIANSLIMYANIGTGIEEAYIKKLEGVKEAEDEAHKLIIERRQQLVRKEWERTDNAKAHLRKQASELMGTTNAIPLYGLWAFLLRRPKQKDILDASTMLIGLSNSSGHSKNEIAKLLKINIVAKRLT